MNEEKERLMAELQAKTERLIEVKKDMNAALALVDEEFVRVYSLLAEVQNFIVMLPEEVPVRKHRKGERTNRPPGFYRDLLKTTEDGAVLAEVPIDDRQARNTYNTGLKKAVLTLAAQGIFTMGFTRGMVENEGVYRWRKEGAAYKEPFGLSQEEETP